MGRLRESMSPNDSPVVEDGVWLARGYYKLADEENPSPYGDDRSISRLGSI